MRLNATRLGSIASSRSFGDQLDDLAGQVPSLDLNFAQNKSLIDDYSGTTLATHTRASSGTFVGSDGVLRTAVTNLLLRSEEFDSASWPKNGTPTVTANSSVAPDGTTTAELFTRTTTGPSFIQQVLVKAASALTYTFSVYAKQSVGNFIALRTQGAYPARADVVFNLSTGAIASAASAVAGFASASATIAPLVNGWYRLTLTATTDAVTNLQVVASANSNGGQIDGTDSVSNSACYLWGAQLEQSSTVGEYIPTTSTINSAPRFDHNPQTGESLGLLVEEARTNSVVNSNSMTAVVTGSPGTLPTGWGVQGNTNGWTREVVGSGSIGALNYVDIRLSGTPTNSQFSATFQVQGVVAASNGQSWSGSVYHQLVGGSLGNVVGYPAANLWNSSSTYLSGLNLPGSLIPTSSLQRYSGSGTISQANTAFISWGITFVCTVGNTYDFTIRFAGPQLELGAFPTSYIPTTTAAATRSADVASISGNNFGTTRTNLLVRSEEFDDASWGKTGSTVTANATTAPNGTLTADKIVEDSSNGTHLVSQFAPVASTSYVYSVYAKAGERTKLIFSGGGFAAQGFAATFNLSNGTLDTNTGSKASIVAVGDGWYRCIVSFTASNTTTMAWNLADASGSNSYLGNNTSGIYLWGAQLETGSAVTPYIQSPSVFTSRASSGTYVGGNGLIQTATTNLLLRSEEFDSGWTGSESNTTVTANTSTAPNGTITADTINFTNASSFRYQSVSNTPAGTTYTFSVWLASGTKTQTVIRIAGSSTGTGSQFVVNLTPTLTRYSVTVTIPSGNTGAFVGFENRVAVGGGDGSTGTIIVWGAQLEQSSTVGEYIPTTSSINSAARYDHDPVSLISKGLLLEEARTNLALDSEDFSAATWTRLGTTFTVDTVASPTGATTADTLLETATTTQHILYSTAPHTFTTATHSIYVKPNGRTNVALRFFNVDDDWVVTVFGLTGNGSVTQTSAGSLSGFSAVSRSIANAGNGWYRISMTATQTSRATFAAVLDLCTSSTPTLAAASGSEVYLGDVTKGVYAWGSQLEAASTVSSYIATTASTVTRAADISTSVATSVFESSWYRQSEGTLFTDCSINYTVPGTSFPLVTSLNDGTSNNRMENGFLTSTLAGFEIVTGGVSQVSAYPNAGGALTRRLATCYRSNDFAVSLNGTSVNTDTSGSVPTVDRLRIGDRTGSPANALFGTIRRLTYWPTRLGNEVLQRITQP